MRFGGPGLRQRILLGLSKNHNIIVYNWWGQQAKVLRRGSQWESLGALENWKV